MIFYPTYFTDKVTDITFELLNKININSLILDVDDTLMGNTSSTPTPDIILWINTLKINGIKIILLSNNFKNRIEPFAKKLNVPYIHFGMKPFTFGIKKALKKISSNSSEAVIIGDQIFTDILAANLFGLRSILVEPITHHNGLIFKFKRLLETKIKLKIKSNKYLNLNYVKSQINLKKGDFK